MYTPNIDKMAEQGLKFNRAYCTNPVCTPSRASLYSGRYLSRHGAWNIGTNIPNTEVLISHRLKEEGYRTHLIGKAHFNSFQGEYDQSVETIEHWKERFPEFTGPYYGFDTVELAVGHTTFGITGHYGYYVTKKLGISDASHIRTQRKSDKIFGGEAYSWELPLELSNTIWTAERTVAFLEKMSKTKDPFLLSVGFQDPHHPHALPKEYDLKIDPSKVPLPDYADTELEDKPPHFKMAHEGTLNSSRFRGEFGIAGHTMTGMDIDFKDISDMDARLGRTYYYGMVELIDKGIGMITEALERLGLDKNTIVVFTTDHGELLGDHGLWMKGPFHYEQLINVPLIISWPGKIAEGRTADSLVSLVDVVPTLLSLCGIEIPEELDGLDMKSVVKDEKSVIRDHVLVECTDDPKGLRLKTIVTERYKLTYYRGEDFGELYDLKEDPKERINLWNKIEKRDIKVELLLKLLDETEKMEQRVKRNVYS
jgi:arylsulfatase A-like enzyme